MSALLKLHKLIYTHPLPKVHYFFLLIFYRNRWLKSKVMNQKITFASATIFYNFKLLSLLVRIYVITNENIHKYAVKGVCILTPDIYINNMQSWDNMTN